MLASFVILLSFLQISNGYAAKTGCVGPMADAMGGRKATASRAIPTVIPDGKDLALFKSGKPLINGGIFDTPIGDQKFAEICWAHALREFVSGLLFKLTGIRILPSADHNGFWHLYEQIIQHGSYFTNLAKKVNSGEMTEQKALNEAVKMLRSRPGSRAAKKAGFVVEPGNDEPTALSEALKYGMVPDEIYDRPITTQAQAQDFTLALKKLVSTILKDPNKSEMFKAPGPADLGANTPLYTLMTGQLAPFLKGSSTNNHLPYRPGDTFAYDGGTYTPVQFMTDRLKFDPTAFSTVTATTENQDVVYRAVTESLTGADPTPVMTGLLIADQQQFEKVKVLSTALFKNDEPDIAGGHEVLTGNESVDTQGNVVAQIFQNSWNFQGLDANGALPATKTQSGYNVVTIQYHRYFVSIGEGPDFVFRNTLLNLPAYQGLSKDTQEKRPTR